MRTYYIYIFIATLLTALTIFFTFATESIRIIPLAPPFPYKYTCSGTTMNYSDYNSQTGSGGNQIVLDAKECK